MSGEATALARNSPKQLKPYQFKPGQTGNPSGRPKGTTLGALKTMARANVEKAIVRLGKLVDSPDDRLAFEAVQFVYLYAFGKPQEGRDLNHQDAMLARHQELIAVPVEQPQLEAETAVVPEVELTPSLPPVPPEAAGATPVASAPSGLLVDSAMPLEAPVGPVVTRSEAPAPQGLRCLYRGRDGQCGVLALSTSQWCQIHRDRLFSMVPE